MISENHPDFDAFEWLMSQKRILFVISGPAGFGVEKRTLDFYLWLISQGYRGEITLLYDEEEPADVIKLLGISPTDLSLNQPLKICTIGASTQEDFLNATPQNCPKAITHLMSVRYFRENIPIEPYNLAVGTSIATAPLEFLKSHLLLLPSDDLLKNKVLCVAPGENFIGRTIEQLYCNTFPSPQLNGAHRKITSGEIARFFPHDAAPTYKNIAELLQLPEKNLISIYGFVHGSDNTSSNILNLIHGLNHYLDRKGDNQRSFLLLFNEFEARYLSQILALTHEESIRPIHFIDGRTPCNFTQEIAGTDEKAIILVYFSAVPAQLFDYLVSQSMLFVAEGYSAQILALNTGTPYLSLPSKYPILTRTEKLFPEAAEQMRAANQALTSPNSSFVSRMTIAQFIRDYYEPQSELAQAWLELCGEFRENNTLIASLMAAFKQKKFKLDGQDTVYPNTLSQEHYSKFLQAIDSNDPSEFYQLCLNFHPCSKPSVDVLSPIQYAMALKRYSLVLEASQIGFDGEGITGSGCFFPIDDLTSLGSELLNREIVHQSSWPFNIMSHAKILGDYLNGQAQISPVILISAMIFKQSDQVILPILDKILFDKTTQQDQFALACKFSILLRNKFVFDRIIQSSPDLIKGFLLDYKKPNLLKIALNCDDDYYIVQILMHLNRTEPFPLTEISKLFECILFSNKSSETINKIVKITCDTLNLSSEYMLDQMSHIIDEIKVTQTQKTNVISESVILDFMAIARAFQWGQIEVNQLLNVTGNCRVLLESGYCRETVAKYTLVELHDNELVRAIRETCQTTIELCSFATKSCNSTALALLETTSLHKPLEAFLPELKNQKTQETVEIFSYTWSTLTSYWKGEQHIFTAFNKQGQEIGSIVFLGTNDFCRYKDEKHHNVMAVTGVFSQVDGLNPVDPSRIKVECSSYNSTTPLAYGFLSAAGTGIVAEISKELGKAKSARWLEYSSYFFLLWTWQAGISYALTEPPSSLEPTMIVQEVFKNTFSVALSSALLRFGFEVMENLLEKCSARVLPRASFFRTAIEATQELVTDNIAPCLVLSSSGTFGFFALAATSFASQMVTKKTIQCLRPGICTKLE